AGAGPPRRSGEATGLGPSGGVAGAGPPGGTTGLRPPGGEAGTESPGTTVGSESTGMTTGTGSDIGSSGWTAGHRVIWQGSGLRVNRHDSEHTGVIRYRIVWLDSGQSGHQASGHLARQRAHRIRYRIIWINSGHRVNWPNRIVRLDQFIMLGRGIRPSRGFRPSRGIRPSRGF
ncbi:unnamed protein product, partial [Staurois parvus]